MGMTIVAVVGGLRLLDIPTLAAVVSLMTIVNTTFSLRGQLQHVHRRLLFWIGLGQLPGIFIGLWLLGYLDTEDSRSLELCLGIFITVGGLAMTIRPRAMKEVSGGFFAWVSGLLGGLLGGMFSASGPVLGWFGYSQPLAVKVIRATLLSSFFYDHVYSHFGGGGARWPHCDGYDLRGHGRAGGVAGCLAGQGFSASGQRRCFEARRVLYSSCSWVFGFALAPYSRFPPNMRVAVHS